MLTPETYAAGARAARREPPGLDATAMARVLEAYEQVKTQRGVIDFEDVLLLTVGILAERDDIARAVRSQYRHFVVDEYQDVNALQQRLLDLWVGERDDLCVVGDPAQTIYSFTGASPRHLLEFPTRHPEAEVVRLVRNYRSTPQIVGLANLVVRGPVRARCAATPCSCRPRAPTARRPVARPPTPTTRPRPRPSPREIAERVADGRVAGRDRRPVPHQRAVRGVRVGAGRPGRALPRARRRAVLLPRARCATRSCCCAVRPAPTTRRSRCPSWSATSCSGPGGPARRPSSGGAGPRAVGVAQRPGRPVRRPRRGHARRPGCPTSSASSTSAPSAQHAPAVQGVTLASLHAAKGLEWDVVFLAGVSDGYLPIMMAETPEAIEEERRLTYVGVTRARRELRLSWSGARTPGARASRRPSRFLDGAASILGDGRPLAAQGRRQGRRQGRPGQGRSSPRCPAHCRTCGTELTTAGPAQDRPLRRPARRPTPRRPSSGCARGGWPSRARPACRPTSSSPTPRSRRSPSASPPRRASWPRSRASGARKLGLYGAQVLALIGGADVESVLENAFCCNGIRRLSRSFTNSVPEISLNTLLPPQGCPLLWINTPAQGVARDALGSTSSTKEGWPQWRTSR